MDSTSSTSAGGPGQLHANSGETGSEQQQQQQQQQQHLQQQQQSPPQPPLHQQINSAASNFSYQRSDIKTNPQFYPHQQQPQDQNPASNAMHDITSNPRPYATASQPLLLGPAPTGAQFRPLEPGVKFSTTFWEDENTICYQIEVRGVPVSRREDSDFINGTKLLNVVGMTRGRRDGILKSEKTRYVVKIGAMNLKGVWIPFDRAVQLATSEGILDLLYPLFVRDIKTFYQENFLDKQVLGNDDSSRLETPKPRKKRNTKKRKDELVPLPYQQLLPQYAGYSDGGYYSQQPQQQQLLPQYAGVNGAYYPSYGQPQYQYGRTQPQAAVAAPVASASAAPTAQQLQYMSPGHSTQSVQPQQQQQPQYMSQMYGQQQPAYAPYLSLLSQQQEYVQQYYNYYRQFQPQQQPQQLQQLQLQQQQQPQQQPQYQPQTSSPAQNHQLPPQGK